MMHDEKFPADEGDPDAAAGPADFFNLAQVDCSVRQALHVCWMALPKDRRTVEELEQQFRRIVERALKDFREDSQAFGEPR
jgi:hypothetical protein